MSNTPAFIGAALKTKIDTLTLTGFGGSSYLQKFPFNLATLKIAEGIYICPITATLGGGTNSGTQVGLGWEVVIIKGSNQSLLIAEVDAFALWRQEFRTTFHDKKPLPTTDVYHTQIEPGSLLIPDAWKANYDASSFIIRCWHYE
tara:strand:- start:4516 stop:4950 length:435 start_codon:yes stop_codon:yes gene_type:complete